MWSKEVVYNLGIFTHFCPWGIFELGGIDTFWAQELKIHKNFELLQCFMYIFLFQNILICAIYIIHKKN